MRKGITKRLLQKWLKCVNLKPSHFGHYLLFRPYFPLRILSHSMVSVTRKSPIFCPSWSLPRTSFLTCCFPKFYPFLKAETESLLLQGCPSFLSWSPIKAVELGSGVAQRKLDWAFLLLNHYSLLPPRKVPLDHLSNRLFKLPWLFVTMKYNTLLISFTSLKLIDLEEISKNFSWRLLFCLM